MDVAGGTWYIVPTPFTDNDRVDTESLETLCDAAVSWGVDGLTILGVMGEVNALSDAERRLVGQTVVQVAGGRVPVAFGCSAPSVRGCTERITEARELGGAAVMIAAPTLTRDGDSVVRFYELVAAADSSLPIIVQDEPVATGVSMPVSTLLAAMRACGSTVVKLEDAPTPPKIARLLAQAPELTVFGGLGGVSAYYELRRGAAGTMTGFAYPEVLRALRLLLADGRPKEAAAVFDRFLPLISYEGQPVVGTLIRKEILRRRGVLATARTRGIATLADAATLAEIDEVLDRVGIVASATPLEVNP